VFNNIGWGEIAFIAVIALFIFGPERLPHVAKEAAEGLKKVRRALTGVREQVNDSLGDDFAQLRDIDLRQYHPKTFIRNQLLADDDEPARVPTASGASTVYTTGRSRDRGTPPPFDSDAT